MEIKLILPDDLKELDLEHDLGDLMYVRDAVKREVKSQLIDVLVEYAVKNHPALTFDEAEIKTAVKERLVDYLVEKAVKSPN